LTVVILYLSINVPCTGGWVRGVGAGVSCPSETANRNCKRRTFWRNYTIRHFTSLTV